MYSVIEMQYYSFCLMDITLEILAYEMFCSKSNNLYYFRAYDEHENTLMFVVRVTELKKYQDFIIHVI